MIGTNLISLVNVVASHFRRRSVRLDEKLLAKLFETAFVASMNTDEGRTVACSICVFDSQQTTDQAPEVLRADRWSLLPLLEPVALTPERLVKMSQAVPPHVGALALRPAPNDEWIIWALIDQEHLVHGFRHHKEDKFYPRAGRFQIEIVGPGCVAIYHDTALLARLQRDSLITRFKDVFHDGPVAEALAKVTRAHESRVLQAIHKWKGPSTQLPRSKQYPAIKVPSVPFQVWLDRTRNRWLDALAGILLQIRDFRHGGALLLQPRFAASDLNIKHNINYRRLDEALVERSASDIISWAFRHHGLSAVNQEQLHPLLFDLEQAERRNTDARRAQDGAMQFIASLTAVDGLVVVTQSMNVRGFGAEILTRRDPSEVYLVSDTKGRRTERIDMTRWGTRHRSMMRYCSQHKGSVGFVVSQDGDVRAMMRVNERLLVWPNIAIERSATQPLEIPCPHCSGVGDLVPVRAVGDE